MPDSSREPSARSDSVDALVERFLSAEETTPDLREVCLWRLSDQLGRISAAEKRHIASMSIAMVVFELLNRSLVYEATLAGVKVVNFGFLQPILPAVVAFVYMRLMVLNRDHDVYTSVYYTVVRQGFPGLYSSHIDRLFTSISGFVFTRIPEAFLSPSKRRMGLVALAVEVLVILTLPVMFGVYAYWQLFARQGFASLITWVTLALTCVFFVLGLMLAFMSATSPPRLDERESVEYSPDVA